MLQFRAVAPSDFEIYNRYRSLNASNASESVFTTLFIWNGYYNLECAENGEFFFIRFNIDNKPPAYLFPIGFGDVGNAVAELWEHSKGRGEKLRFLLVTKENKDRLTELFAGRFTVKQVRDSFDYVYLTEKMISLSGKKLHSKKNHLNYFLSNYTYEYKKVQDKLLLERCALKAYQLVASKTKNINPYELGAMKKYFNHFFEFKQTGAVIEINGEIAAMSFGEKIRDDTALIQIELADERYRGAYQAINKLFCENEWKDCKYVNREEDMGIEGLRHAKESYQPQFLIEKYTIEETE